MPGEQWRSRGWPDIRLYPRLDLIFSILACG
jgi:hypothetical protein